MRKAGVCGRSGMSRSEAFTEDGRREDQVSPGSSLLDEGCAWKPRRDDLRSAATTMAVPGARWGAPSAGLFYI